jgi:TolB-like protein/DNA-binding winged helix-turn-helix (wHTH) protein
MRYVFADYELDEQLYELRRAGEALKLDRKVFDVLVYLIQHRDRLVTKDELLDNLWPGQVVGEAALTRCITSARKALGDDGNRQEFIKTQHGRGYRFVAAVAAPVPRSEFQVPRQAEAISSQPSQGENVSANTSELNGDSVIPAQVGIQANEAPNTGRDQEAYAPSPIPSRARRRLVLLVGLILVIGAVITAEWRWVRSLTSPPPVSDSSTLPLPDKPSIIVLPFVNLSGDPEQEYFSDGMTEEITAALSRLSGLFVIARTSAFTYKGKARKVQDISKEMGVRYILEGSARKADKQTCIIAQLIDAATGEHLWSEQYDRPLKDIFAVQDEIVQKITTTLKLQLTLKEKGYLVRKRTQISEAYDYYLRGFDALFRGWNETKKEATMQARQMLERATELDPTYAEAYAYLGATYWHEWFFRWNYVPEVLDRAVELEQKALTLDESLAGPHVVLGFIALWKKQHEQALIEARQALTLDPNNAEYLTLIGQILSFSGHPQEGIELVEKGMRLNPRHPPLYFLQLSMTYRMAGRYKEALAPGEKFSTLAPNSTPAHFNLAVIYSELGMEEKAQAIVADWQRITPGVSVEFFRQFLPFKDPADVERHLAALRKAGLK